MQEGGSKPNPLQKRKPWNSLFRNNIGGPSHAFIEAEEILKHISNKYLNRIIFEESKLASVRE